MVYRNYLYAYVMAFGGLIANVFFYYLFLTGSQIMSPSKYLIFMLVLYFAQRIAMNNYRPLIRKYEIVMQGNYVLMAVLIVSSWVYYVWSFEFMSNTLVAKSFLLLMGLALMYIFVMIKRASYTMSKKIKNPRISDQKKVTYFEKIKDADEKLNSDKPYFVLGVDINTELDD